MRKLRARIRAKRRYWEKNDRPVYFDFRFPPMIDGQHRVRALTQRIEKEEERDNGTADQ